MYIEATDPDSKDIYLNSALMAGSSWNLPTSFATSSSPVTAEKTFQLFNPGSARADVAVEIAGDFGTGVIIDNLTTGQQMKFIGGTKSNTTNVGKWIVCDGLNGKTFVTNGSTVTYGFLYHDFGFIQLSPAFPCYRNVFVNGAKNSNNLSVNNQIVSEDMVGQYICAQSGGTRYKITAVNTSTNKITIGTSLSADLKGMAVIFRMNELSIRPVTTMSITRLNFVYKPTFY